MLLSTLVSVQCIGVLSTVYAISTEKYFKGVFLDEAWLQGAQANNIETVSPSDSNVQSDIQPAVSCAAVPWCRIVCHDTIGTLTMRDIFVLPFAGENAGSNTLKCWTISSGSAFDLRIITVADQSPLHSVSPWRVPENVLDGLYTFTMNECWAADRIDNPYALFDLQGPTTVRKVMMVAQPINAVANFFGDFEIRLGNSLITGGDFSSYTLLGYYSGTPVHHTIYEAIPTVPKVGRYLSIQRIALNVELQVCHLEIYS